MTDQYEKTCSVCTTGVQPKRCQNCVSNNFTPTKGKVQKCVQHVSETLLRIACTFYFLSTSYISKESGGGEGGGVMSTLPIYL